MNINNIYCFIIGIILFILSNSNETFSIGVPTEYKFQTTTEQYIPATLKNYFSSTKKTAILQNKIDFSESIDNIIIKNDGNIYTVYIDGDESEARNILDNYTHLEYIYPNSIINIPLINKDNYTYCIITVDRAKDLHFIIVIKDNTDNIYTVGFGNGVDHLYTGYYSSPNSYSIMKDLYIKNIRNMTDFNAILFTSWDKLDEISRINAEILGWKKSIWDIIIMQVYFEYNLIGEFENPDYNYIIHKLILYNALIQNSELEFPDIRILRAYDNPHNIEQVDEGSRDNCFYKTWQKLTSEEKTAANYFGLDDRYKWNNNKYTINLKSFNRESTYRLIKYRKVSDWLNLSDNQFEFLKLLKNNIIKENDIKSLPIPFCGISIYDNEITNWINGTNFNIELSDELKRGFYSQQCNEQGCCLDGAVSFINDEHLDIIMSDL